MFPERKVGLEDFESMRAPAAARARLFQAPAPDSGKNGRPHHRHERPTEPRLINFRRPLIHLYKKL